MLRRKKTFSKSASREGHQVFLNADLGDAGERGVTGRVVALNLRWSNVCQRIADRNRRVRRRHRALLDAIVEREVAGLDTLLEDHRGRERFPLNRRCDTACPGAREIACSTSAKPKPFCHTMRSFCTMAADIPGCWLECAESRGSGPIARTSAPAEQTRTPPIAVDTTSAMSAVLVARPMSLGLGTPDEIIASGPKLPEAHRGSCVTFSAIRGMTVKPTPSVTIQARTTDIWIVRRILYHSSWPLL